ncbi:MAG: sigma-54-dependent Fis family transcriptional regulator [Deltaproteobacteria bacterium]|nr:sigma-54-dependent Fis family transcriptional regulator [Deltaproteobacteria bacterium]
MSGAKILVVDDELIVRESLGGWLERDGHMVDKAASGEESLEKFEKTRYDIILLDIKMEGMSGLEVLKRVKEIDPDVSVVMITAYGSIPSAIEAMKSGAYEYLLKPFDPDELMVLIEKIRKHQAERRETQFLREQYKERTRFENMIGQSIALQGVFDLIESVAPTDSTVLINGETGTGKGLAARAIHTKSRRGQGPFVVVNCGAFPEHLLESELFGYQKGAFTDAKITKKGRLELAHGGTLFLDEVGEISTRMQIDLLRVLEDHIFYRVGGTQPIEADFRVIAATNKDLERAIKEGTFREDLYYRLNVISFTMPPLREHKEDIPLLAEYFLHRFAQETNKPVNQVGREALDEMMLYDWPGNVRELGNAVERAVVVGKGPRILPQDLPIFRPEYVSSAPRRTLREVEIGHLESVLKETRWSVSKSAEILGIDRSTLYDKIKRYDLRKPG